jgi:hypothetical protein
MSDEIPPAMTAEDWRDWSSGGQLAHVSLRTAANSFDDPAALMALVNYRLADDDPRKITRADVVWLRGAISMLQDSVRKDEWAARLGALTAKLSALLPPAP